MTISVCVFDAYGTLFDVAAAARRTAKMEGYEKLANVWQTIASDWRLKQLQYTWIQTLTGMHTGFWQVTCNSLDWALEAAGLSDDFALRSKLLSLYRELDAYPEVEPMLRGLRKKDFKTAILSNGTSKMLSDATAAANLTDQFDQVISVDAVGVFKPHSRVYQLVLDHFDCTREEVIFVSSNGWDAAAAQGFGFNSVWANRNNEPVDKLPWIPHRQLVDLSEIVAVVEDLT